MRRPRAGLRDRWVDAVVRSDVGNACKVLLLYLAHEMNDGGKVSMRREQLASVLHVHEQRVAERISEARQAGLLDLVGGTGSRGIVAQYVAVFPRYVPPSGTHGGRQHVPASGTHAAGVRTGERYVEIGTHSPGNSDGYVPPSGTHNARAYLNASSERNNNVRELRASHATKSSSEERVAAHSPLAARCSCEHLTEDCRPTMCDHSLSGS